MIDDPYSAPASFNAGCGRSENALQLYTPLQVAVFSAVSGALGLCFALWANYRALGKVTESRLTVLAGVMVAFLQCSAALVFKAAPHGLGALIIVGLTIAGILIAHRTQLSKKQIAVSKLYACRSAMNVTIWCVAWLVASMIFALCVIVFWQKVFGYSSLTVR